jgi:sn-glycerol 3-phosphate transport system substrate-binding protein
VSVLNRRQFLSRASLSLAGAAGATSLLAACGGTRDSYGQPKGSLPDAFKGRQRIVLWSSFADVPGLALQKLADGFNSSQKEYYVEVQFQGSYDETFQKTLVGRVGGEVPDLVTLSDVTWGKFLIGDALQPWDELFAKDGFDTGVYNQPLLKEGVAKGKQYWIPLARSTPLFYYNKTVFKKAGLPDRAPKSWQELSDWADDFTKVKTPGGLIKQESYYKKDYDWQFLGNCWQQGGNWADGLDITIDSPECVEALERQYELIFKSKRAYMADDAGLDFTNQLTASVTNSTGAMTKYTELAKAGGFKLGAGFVPEGTEFGVPTGGSGFCAFRGVSEDRRQGAMEFIKYMATPARSASWTVQTGYLPIIKGAEQEPALQKLLKTNPNFSVALKQLPKTRKQDAVRLLVPNANITVYTGLQKVWADGQSPKAVLKDVAERLRKATERVADSINSHIEV